MPSAQTIIYITTHTDEEVYPIIGAKASSRALLTQLKLPTPPAFVITPTIFYQFLHFENGLNKWRNIIEAVRIQDPENVVWASRELQKLIRNHPFDSLVSEQLFKAYDTCIHHHWAHLTISPTKHTKAPVNFPLPVIKGETALLDFLRQIWSAQITPHALALHLTLNPGEIFSPAPILVSQFEPATSSGSITTIDPLTKDKNLIRIEAIWGTNPQHDPKSLPADSYIVTKNTYEVISRQIATQTEMVSIDRFGHYKLVSVPIKQRSHQKLSSDHIQQLIKLAQKVHDYSLKPHTINWLVANNQLFLTRYSEAHWPAPKITIKPPSSINKNITVIARGLMASPGITTAPISRPAPQKSNLSGMIVVVKQTDVQLLNRIRSAQGIIIENGGLTSDLAHTAREVGIPTIVGTGPLTIPDGQVITLNASQGIVTQDKTIPTPTIITSTSTPPRAVVPIKTATKIFFNLSRIDTTQHREYLLSDGVGMCKGNDLLLTSGTHPNHQVKNHPKEVREILIRQLSEICSQFGDRPVFYYPFDLDSLSAQKLTHGHFYEPTIEQNPLWGYHGAIRLAAGGPVFKEELTAIYEVRNKHNQKNLSLVIPFVRSAKEYLQVKKQIASFGLARSPSFKLYAEIGTVASEYFLPQLIEDGVDGILLNLDLLASSILGYDPNSAEVDQNIDPLAESVKASIKSICKSVNSHHISVITVGHKIDQYKDVLEMVIKQGSSAVSISSHRYESVKNWIHDIELTINSKVR